MKIIKLAFSDKNNSAGKIIEELEKSSLNEDGFNSSLSAKEINKEEEMQALMNSLNEKSILLGGEHSATYSSFKEFSKKNPGAGIIVFDAHPDCCKSNNCFKKEYLKKLVDEGIVDKKRLIIAGIRNWDGQEKEFIELNKINYFDMKKITDLGIQEFCDIITETANKWPALYLSIDLDVVDPAFAPGVYCAETGGLTSREFIYLLQRLKRLRNLKMMDLVEINPENDVNGITIKLAAKIIKELS